MKNLYLFILATMMMAACSTPSINMDYKHAITEKKAQSIKVGVTTREDMDNMFGKPETKMRSEQRIFHFYKDYNLNSVWVVFDNNEVVKEYNWFN